MRSIASPKEGPGTCASRAGAPSSSIRVLAWPAFKNRPENPYNALLSAHLRMEGVCVFEFSLRALVAGRYHVWHFHWPENTFIGTPRPIALAKLVILVGAVIGARARGTKLVWTCHNLEAHEASHPHAHVWFRRWLLPRLDGVIVLACCDVETVRCRYPCLADVPIVAIPHGHYIGAYPNTVTPLQARRVLGLAMTDRVLLFFGQLRPYKNIPLLIERFRALEDEDLRLVIAGRPSATKLRDQIVRAAAYDPRVRLHLRFVAEEEVQTFMHAADLVVLPYRRVLNSGAALAALSFLRPIMVPAAGAMKELRDGIGSDFVRTYEGSLGEATLACALEWLDVTPRDQAALERRLCREFGWSDIAARTATFYRSLAS